MMSPGHLAQIAYEAYGRVTDHKNFRGGEMPQWSELPVVIQQAWMGAAHAVTTAVLDPKGSLIPESEVRECHACGFIWPPNLADNANRCLSCGTVYA